MRSDYRSNDSSLWKSADGEYNRIYKMMSDIEGPDKVEVIIVFSSLWKKDIKKNSQEVQNNPTNQTNVLTQCTSELWSLLLKDVVYAKMFVQDQSRERKPI